MSYDTYSTHAPVIAAACMMVDGPVLELGMGYGSTPLLHSLCRNRKTLVSMETNPEWMKKFEALRTAGHRLIHAPASWDTQLNPYDLTGSIKWAAALVDCQPGEIRSHLIKRLQGLATFIVAHDSEKDYRAGGDYKYETVAGGFRYVSEYRFLRPYTLILSDDEPFPLDTGEQRWVPPQDQQEYFDKNGIKP